MLQPALQFFLDLLAAVVVFLIDPVEVNEDAYLPALYIVVGFRFRDFTFACRSFRSLL
jgi:hypothetical protein